MAAITETLKLPSFRYPKKVPDTYLDFVAANSDEVDCGTQFLMYGVDTQFTISAWVFLPSTATARWNTICAIERSDANAGSAQFNINAETDDIISYEVLISTSGSTRVQANGTIPVPRERWSHVAFIVDNLNDQVTLVVNGVAETVSFTIVPGVNFVTTNLHFRIGRYRNQALGNAYGDLGITNLRLYEDYLLPVEEAQAQYIRGVNDYGHSDETGLSASYHLNEGTGTVAIDAKESSQNHGTLAGTGTQEDRWINSTPRTYRETVLHDSPKAYWRMKDPTFIVNDETGNFVGMQHVNIPVSNMSQAGPFPGSKSVLYVAASSYYSLMGQVVLDSGNNINGYSGEAWIKRVSAPGINFFGILSQRNVSNFTNFALLIDDSPANSLLHHESPISADLNTDAESIILDVWHHVVWTKDNASSLREIYIDGVLSASDATPETSVTALDRVMIGAYNGNGFFDGYISEVAIYDYKLSAQQVADHYLASIHNKTYAELTLADSPTYYWRLGESSGPTAVDELGVNDLTYGGTPIYGEPGLIVDTDTSIDFNGAGYAEGGSFGTITFPVTVEAWVSVPASLPNQSPAIWGTHMDTINYYGLWCQLNGTARTVSLHIGDGGPQQLEGRLSWTTVGTIPVDTPTHVAVVVTNTSTVAIYFNGVLQATTFAGLGSGLDDTVGIISIGRTRYVGHIADFTIDEVAMWNAVGLTQTQIYGHYARGRL